MSKIRLVLSLLFIVSNLYIYSSNKIVVISSYGTDYKWSNDIMNEIRTKINKTNPTLEIVHEFLSSELLENIDNWNDNMNVLLNNYKNSKPLAIVLVSDEAWMAYRDADIDAFKDIPLVLCAVKPHSIKIADYISKKDSLKLSDYESTTNVMKKYNATGVLREMNTSGYLSLIHDLIPNLNQFTFITDSRHYGIYTRLLLERQAKIDYPDIPIQYLDGRFISTDSLFNVLPNITPTTGVLLTSWLTGERGFESSKDYIYSQIAAKLKTPIFITNDIGLEKGFFLGGYLNKASFWGDKTADIIIQIINGKNYRNIKPQIYFDNQCFATWSVLKKHKIDFDELPQNTVLLNAPNPFWVSYKYYIIGFAIAFFIFLLFYIYTFRSNIRLQQAHRLLLNSINETKTANVKLKETQTDLIKALHKAEESDKLKSAFLANMSHEIRTPLNAIVGFSWLMIDPETEEIERDGYASIIQRNSDLLLQLLSDILDLSKIEAGVLEFAMKETNIYEVCNNVITSFHNKCKPEVKICLNDTSDKNLQIITDQIRLTQVLSNLTNNAIKFTEKGVIEIGFNPYDDNLIEFYVKDTGIGIPENKTTEIFERFTKINSYIEGSGLGLSICKTIVEVLGGTIGVDSQLGKGSRFWFRINKNGNNL